MATRLIVIDDTDPSVKYSGKGWFQDMGSQDGLKAFGPTFQHTLHGTKSNDSFSISFQGSSIQVYGTNDRVDTGAGILDPSWECFVDNISIGTHEGSTINANNWPLCEHEHLVDTAHELTVNVIQRTASGRTFWFDYVRYAPSTGVSDDHAYVLVDNIDPDIKYGTGWGPLAAIANSTTKFGAELTFNFTGKRLSWFGFIPKEFSHNSTSGTFSVDGGDPTTFGLAGLPSPTSDTVFNQIFLSTTELPAGPHSLRVVHGGNDGQTPLVLDHLIITNTSAPTASNSSSPTTQPSSTGHKTHVAAIVGGIFGGVMGIIIVLMLVFVWRRRRRQRVQLMDELIPPPGISPFITTRHLSAEFPGVTMPNASANDSHSALPGGPLNTASGRRARKRGTEPRTESGPIEPVLPVAVVHEDSGRRFHQGENVLVEVPPGYSEN